MEEIKDINTLKLKKRNIKAKISRCLELLVGTVVEYRITCGKKNCKCQKGEKHRAFYLSVHRNGKTKNRHIPKKKLAEARKMSENYKKLKELLHELSDINYKLLKLKDK